MYISSLPLCHMLCSVACNVLFMLLNTELSTTHNNQLNNFVRYITGILDRSPLLKDEGKFIDTMEDYLEGIIKKKKGTT